MMGSLLPVVLYVSSMCLFLCLSDSDIESLAGLYASRPGYPMISYSNFSTEQYIIELQRD